MSGRSCSSFPTALRTFRTTRPRPNSRRSIRRKTSNCRRMFPPTCRLWREQEAQGYYAHCTALDRCIGELLETLDETRLAANTILVFTSDHGEMLGRTDARPYFKQVAWNESAHVPFLLRYPAMHGEQGREVSTPLTTPDILPTLLGLAGVEVPATIEGEDLSSPIRAGRELDDRAVLYMGVAPFMPREFAQEYRAMRTQPTPMCGVSRGRGCCSTTNRTPIRWTTSSENRNTRRWPSNSMRGCRPSSSVSVTTSAPVRPMLPSGVTRSGLTAASPTTNRMPNRRRRGVVRSRGGKSHRSPIHVVAVLAVCVQLVCHGLPPNAPPYLGWSTTAASRAGQGPSNE